MNEHGAHVQVNRLIAVATSDHEAALVLLEAGVALLRQAREAQEVLDALSPQLRLAALQQRRQALIPPIGDEECPTM